MDKKGYLAIIIVIVGVLLVGVIVFSGSGISASHSIISKCQAEKRHQSIPILYADRFGEGGGFVAPSDVGYSSVIFTGFGAIIEDNRKVNAVGSGIAPKPDFILNGVVCGQISPGLGPILTDFTDTCAEALQEGMNSISLTDPQGDTLDLLMLNASFELEHIADYFDEIALIGAEHLDENRDFVSDIFQEVSELDGVWSEEILEGHYVRVVFENYMNNDSNLTLYPRIVDEDSDPPGIAVYEGLEEAWVGGFGGKFLGDDIVENEYNTIGLSGFGVLVNDTFIREMLVEMKIRSANC